MALLLGASLLLTASAQFIPAPTDLTESKGFLDIPVRWKEVPEGTCELTPGVKSFSGYVDVFEDQHIFFWFFEARNEIPEEAPLTGWINGGPGSSSMVGVFEELGPCRVNADGDVYRNEYAWNNASNMIFIDHPAQVGFSYSTPVSGYQEGDFIIQLPNDTCPDYASACGTYPYANVTSTANSTINAAPSMWRTIQGFMGAFPQYSRNEFNFATESYGGHYVPVFSAYIESQNELIDSGDLEGAHHVNLSSILIGNGWYDPLVQYEAYYNFTVFPGNTYDYDPYNASIKAKLYNEMYGPGNCYDQIVDCKTRGIDEICSAADNFCQTMVEEVLDDVTGRDEYDIRELTPDPFPYGYYKDYLNSPKLQKAIGAYVNFSSPNHAVSLAFGATGDDVREEGVVQALRRLVKQGIYVILYAGDADYNCNWLGNEVIVDTMKAPGFDQAGYQNVTTSDNIVHGQVKQSDNFAWVRIYESGHEVPFYQPLVALEMFERALKKVDIASGKKKSLQDYKTVGTPKSTYREGNGTIQFEVLPADATYNTTLNGPNPYGNSTSGAVAERRKNSRGARIFETVYGRAPKGRR